MASKSKTSKSQPTLISEQFDLPSVKSDIASIRQSILLSMPKADIQCQNSWVYTRKQYAFAAFLVHKDIVLYWAKGHIRKQDCESVGAIMQSVIDYSGRQNQLIQILDLSHIRSFSLAARKSYESINERLGAYWKKSYYIFSGLSNTLFKIYAALHPNIRQQVTLTESIPQALKLCQEGIQQPQDKATPFDPQQASHEELIAQYLELDKKYQSLVNEQQKKADLLLKNIGKTSWEEDFGGLEPPIPQDDPFYNVFEALSLLKQDLGEIYEQQRQHNYILEEEVARRTRQLSSVIENTSDMIMSVDHLWCVQVVNTAFQQHFREFQQSDIKIGDNLLALYKDEDNLNYWKSRFERAFGGERFQEQISIPVDGKNIHYELTYNPIRHSDNKEVTEVSVFGRNITALRYAQDIARENELNLTRALKIARAGSWELNLDTGKVTIGKEGLQLLGYPEEGELSLSIDEFILELLHPKDASLVRQRIEYAKSQLDNPNFHDQFQYRLKHKKGHILHMMLYSRFKSGKRGVIYGITQDISLQKETEEKLLRQNASLRKLNSELDHFVYSVSHDLRAPLASVLGLINISRLEEDPEVVRHYLELKEKSIKKLDTYIQEIIDLSKNARLEVAKEPVDFRKLIDDIYEEQHYDQASLEILKLTEVKQQQAFFSDCKRLRVILQNLISNALRYADLSRDKPYVKVGVILQSGRAILTVEDNGIGIQATHLSKIFDMFYRANQVRTGSGLGLYIVQETLDKLGGEISVTSQPGTGTKFTVILNDLRN